MSWSHRHPDQPPTLLSLLPRNETNRDQPQGDCENPAKQLTDECRRVLSSVNPPISSFKNIYLALCFIPGPVLGTTVTAVSKTDQVGGAGEG